jgi:hypothetical protein
LPRAWAKLTSALKSETLSIEDFEKGGDAPTIAHERCVDSVLKVFDRDLLLDTHFVILLITDQDI